MNKVAKIDYAYHTHTFRCGHAFGTDEEFVKEAINEGFEYLGFSDHGFFLMVEEKNGGRNNDYFYDYIESVNNLKQKYKGQIKIFLGGEFEYCKELDWYYKELKEKYGYDYLICGQHSYVENNSLIYYFKEMDDMEKVEKYVNDVIAAIKSRHFAYIAHPDLFFNRITKITPKILGFCRDIVKTAIEFDTPLELNLGGLRFNNIVAEKNHGFPYPNKEFFKIVGELGAKVVIGVDTHLPSEFKSSDYNHVLEFVKEFNLNLIKDFRVK